MNHPATGHNTHARTVCVPTRSQSLQGEGWTLVSRLVAKSALERPWKRPSRTGPASSRTVMSSSDMSASK